MTRTTIALLLAGGFFAHATAACAAPFAMVTDLKGEAWAIDRGQPKKLALLGYLENPTEIKLGGRIAITYFASGVQYTFDGPARVVFDTSAPRVLQGAAGNTTKVTPDKSFGNRLSDEQWRRLQHAAVVMRDINAGFGVIAPDNTVILDALPEFRWNAARGAKDYQLTIYGPDNAIVHETTTERTAIRPGLPKALESGQQYRWRVLARGGGKPANAEGHFVVAEPDTKRRLMAIKPPSDASLGARVFYATLLEAQGHSYDAGMEWKALARDYPNEPEIALRAR